jgi:glutathione S-transferase
MFFEKQRSSPSQEWTSRQQRKVDGGLCQLASWAGDREFLVEDRFTLADIAAGSVLGYLRVRFQDHPWQEEYPNLKRYSDRLEARESFKTTIPTPQTIKDRIV